MKYSLVSDIMYVRVGERGPIWAGTEEILESINLAKKYNLNGIEFWGWENRDIDAIADKCQALGIEVATICSQSAEILGDPERIEEMVSGFQNTIPVAHKLGTKGIIFNANQFPREAARETVHNAMVEGLRKMAPLAEAADVTILLEPCSGGYFHDSAEAFAILDEVGSDHVKLLYDLFHFQLIEGNLTATLKANLSKIGHIHGAGAPERCELSSGEQNYLFLLETLKRLGYEGWFGLEFFTFVNREEKVAASCDILLQTESF